jgi:hypothetical protein
MTSKRKHIETNSSDFAHKIAKLDDEKMNEKSMVDMNESQDKKESNLRVLHKILRKEESNHPNSCANEANNLPPVSGIFINSIGFISIPLLDIQKEQLKLICKKISAGIYELDWSNIQSTNPIWSQQVKILSEKIAESLGLSGKFDLEPKKIILNEGSRGRSKQHHFDASNGELANLIVQLPSVYTGGNMIIHDKSHQTIYDFGQSEGKSQFSYHYVAFNSNVDFELQPLKSGSRILLFYSFITPFKVNLRDKNLNLIQTMSELAQPNVKIAIELEEKYNLAAFDGKGLSKLQGVDLERFLMLKETNAKLSENEKFCFSIALSSVGVQTFETKDAKKSTKSSSYHTCDCNRCGYDDDSDEDEFDRYCNYHDDDDEEEEEDDDDIEYEIDENADQSSKSKLIRPIETWYDADGNRIFQKSNSDLRFFSKIIHVSSEKPFVDNLDEENGWKRKNSTINGSYFKYVLAMWPKKYENRILIEMDLEAYIRSTYKELLCDCDANFDSACENLEVIINELTDNKNDSKLAYEYIYNILESLKFIQDDELTLKFLKSRVFKNAFGTCNKEIIIDLVLLIKEFSIEQLKHCVFNLINFNKNIQKCADLIIELYNKDEKEFAFECLKAFILPDLNSLCVSQLNKLKLLRIPSESISIAISLFKTDEKYQTEDLKVEYLKQMQSPELSNVLNNFEVFLVSLISMNLMYTKMSFFFNFKVPY